MRGDKTMTGVLIILASATHVVFSNNSAYSITESIGQATISVNISQITMVDINVSNISWSSNAGYVLEPGSVADRNTEINNHSIIWIENTGTTNITKIWLETSYSPSSPFGTGSPARYDPANMVVVDTSINGEGNYTFVNRVEFPENDSMYVKTNNPISPAQAQKGYLFGRFRNASNEYFFEFQRGTTDGDCSDGVFYISNLPKNKTSIGPADLKSASHRTARTFSTLTGMTGRYAGNWSYGEVRVGGAEGPWYCVAIPQDCSKIFFSTINADAPGTTQAGCENVPAYLSESVMVPGDVKSVWLKAYIPLGVTAGVLGSGTGRTMSVFVQN